jgi:hypothetical protein
MKVNNFVVDGFFIATGLLIAFLLESENQGNCTTIYYDFAIYEAL